jgi:hypothetical protein
MKAQKTEARMTAIRVTVEAMKHPEMRATLAVDTDLTLPLTADGVAQLWESLNGQTEVTAAEGSFWIRHVRDEHGGCLECGKLVSGRFGHGPSCSVPTGGEPTPVLFS